MDDSDIRHHRYGEDAGHVSGLKGGFESSEIVELNDARGLDGIHRRADVAAARSGFSFDERDETLVHAAVVAIVIDEDFRPRRDFACNADGETIRFGSGERELPVWKAEAAGEFFADPYGIFSWKHEGDALFGLKSKGL